MASKVIQRAIFAIYVAVLGAQVAFADQVASTSFKGLNNNDNSVIIDASEAQDLLNVNVTPGGTSIEKRDGYGVYKALSTAKPMRGGHKFFNSTGDDVQVWGSSTSLYGITADGTPVQLISSATLSSTWDCTDTQGSAYCVNSSRDAYVKTDGATKSWYSAPLGTMIESTPERVVVAGISGAPNSLYVSQSNNFINYTIGVNTTDSFIEPIASPGSKLTHIRWGCAKLLWWKDQSFGYFDFENQFQAQVKIVSNSIGTFDNTSAQDPGGAIWFRGQDGHTYRYDCSALEKMSIDITPNVQISGSRSTNLWTQTSQSDWQAGTGLPSGNFSTTISAGDVVLSSTSATDTVTADFSQGTLSNTTTYAGVSVKISTDNAGNINDNGMEGTYSTNFTGSAFSFKTCDSVCGSGGQGGSQWAQSFTNGNCGGSCGGSCANDSPTLSSLQFVILDQNGVGLSTTSLSMSQSCTWSQQIITDASLAGKRVKYKWTVNNAVSGMTTNSTYVFPGTISFYYRCPDLSGLAMWCDFDSVSGGSSTITSGQFTSRTFDTGRTSNVAQVQANWTVNTSTPYVEMQTSTNGTAWTYVTGSTGTNASVNRYIRYLSSFTVSGTENALTTLDDVTVVAISSGGTFLSAVKNAPNLTAWSTFGANVTNTAGTHTFYMRSSTNTFTVTLATPAWTAQSNGALIGISTGTYFQVRDDFTATNSTASLALNDFTVNWFEGAATDQSYMIYFDNAIWESVAFGAGQSSNNYIFRFDLINKGWTLYNFGAGGLLVQRDVLYFGDTSLGNIFNFGTVTSDNGTAINAFWKSKDFTGQDPFLQNQLSQIDTFAKKDQGSTLTATYTLDTSTSTSYSIVLSSTTQAIIQNRKQLPSGKLGYTFNIQYGDTSTSSAWELFGYRIGFLQLPYRPTQ